MVADRRPSLTASASRLLASDQASFSRLEDALGRMYGRKALLFNSGYHANTGLIAALAPAGTLIVADKLVHASIIDGYKLSGADLARFRHNDMAHLESIIRSKSGRYDRILVVTESVFSMDGDSPDMNALVDIRRRYDEVMLYVDEAHGFAVSSPDGLGLTMALDRPGYVDVDRGYIRQGRGFDRRVRGYGGECAQLCGQQCTQPDIFHRVASAQCRVNPLCRGTAAADGGASL